MDSPDSSSSDAATTIPIAGIADIALAALLLLLLLSLVLSGFINITPDHMELNNISTWYQTKIQKINHSRHSAKALWYILYESGSSTACNLPDNTI